VIYEHLCPISKVTPEAFLASLDEVGRLYADMMDAGWDVEVGVTTTPDGDVFTFAIDHDRPLASA